MNVLLLNYEYPPLGGGAANATAHLLREFAQDPELNIDLVTSSTGISRVEELSERITAHFLDIGKEGNLHYQTNRDLLAYSWRAYRYAKHLAKRTKYDLCHAFFGIPCGYIARKLGFPYIVSLRGSDVPFYNERFHYPDRLVFKRLSVRIWSRAAWVVANSAGLRDLALRSAPKQRIEVIYNGVDTTAFQPASEPRQEGQGLRVLCVSRLIERKGIQYLIRAMAQLHDLGARLTLVGDGNEKASLQELAHGLGVSECILFTGAVDHEGIADLYRQHDVFVLPSLNEGMSNTVLEAMACGLPIVMTDTGGAAELLKDGVNGYLIDKRATRDLVARLRAYAENPEEVISHGAESRRLAESLSWRSVAAAYKDLYLATAAGSR